MNILTLSDGYGDSRACPTWYPEYHKWPAILGLMTKGTNIIDLSRYGAGNEYMLSCLRHHVTAADMVLVQWTTPQRLDLILAHPPDLAEQWKHKIELDPIYHDNFQIIDKDRWWLSSNSTLDWVKNHNVQTISKRQHETRSKIWIEYGHLLLGSKPHGFLLTYDSHYLNGINVNPATWIWHGDWLGMDKWRKLSRYRDLDFGLTQPIPLINFDFIRQFIQPKFDLPWRSEKEIQAVESMLFKKYNQYKDNRPT